MNDPRTPEPGLTVGRARYPGGPPTEWPAWSPPAIRPGGGPGAPVPPDSGPGAKGAIVAVVAGALAVVLLVAVAVVNLVDDGGPDGVSSASTTTTEVDEPLPPSTGPGTTDPSGPPSSGPPPSSEPVPPGGGSAEARPLAEVLPEIIDFVERTRGHTFKTAPKVEAVSDAEFVRRLLALYDTERRSFAIDQVVDQALGLIPPGTDLEDIARTAASSAVLGYYDPDTKDLLVKGSEITPFVRAVIAHELTHALDDQYFDLSRLDRLDMRPDESAFGLVAVVEGTSRWVETAYRETFTPEEDSAYSDEETRLGLEQTPALLEVPIPYLVEQQVPYVSGLELISSVADAGGTAAIDEAMRRPATTSEQILDPEIFRQRQPAVDVAAPRPDGAQVDAGAVGAVDLRILELVGDPSKAYDAISSGLEPVEGFGGGRYVAWKDGARSCIRMVVTGDDAAATRTVETLVRAWATATSGVVSTRSAGTSTVVEATRCA